jgi:hypothetical protein
MGGEATRVAVAPPPAASTPDIGLGRPDKELPPLPPPPKSLPITRLNPTQVVLRTVIVLGCLYLLFVVGRMLIQRSTDNLCNTAIPLKMCQ